MSAKQYFLVQTLAEAVKAKRGERSLREAAAQITGVSASTLNRIEQERLGAPDLGTLLAITAWLLRPLSDFIGNSPLELPERFAKLVAERRLEAALRRDKATVLLNGARDIETQIETAIAAHHRGNTHAFDYLRHPNQK